MEEIQGYYHISTTHMTTHIFTIQREAEAILDVKRSKFVGKALRCDTPENALGIIRRIRKSSRDADHHVWAFRLGNSGEQARYNDDGEPQGTAGPPVLEVLKRRDLTNVVIVVTRYFGGIKLGAGGLVHAYGDAARMVIEKAGLKELRRMTEIRAVVPYPALTAFENYLQRENFDILSKDFQDIVTVTFRIPSDREADFRSVFGNLVNGKPMYTVIGEKYL
jgi:uncharacterized YigZ family protein